MNEMAKEGSLLNGLINTPVSEMLDVDHYLCGIIHGEILVLTSYLDYAVVPFSFAVPDKL